MKPNLNTADPPPASSDPLFVKATIELLYEHGASKVVLGESSMLGLSTGEVLTKTGMLDAAREAGADVLVFDEWVDTEVNGRYLKKVGVAKAALNAHKIVYAACLKTHRLAEFTSSLKIAVDFVRPRDRIGFHLSRLCEKVAELNTVFAPDLILVDARKCFISGGPSAGIYREPGLILASGDRIAVDVEGLRILKGYTGNSLNKDVWQMSQIRRAIDLGIGAKSQDGYLLVEVV
ncbi:MAG: DUF362 domain-containing protein [Chloroflexi bacterium]|nr:DUF362 domain-containing protein [Chloroflexota bacterium]